MPRRTTIPLAAVATAISIALSGAQLAPAALAQSSNSLQQLVTPQTQPTTTAAPITTAPSSPTASSSGGLSTLAQAAIFAGALVLIGVIGFVIMRDARRAAPVKSRDAAIAGDRSGAGRAERLRRQRARAKQARKARKRNKRVR